MQYGYIEYTKILALLDKFNLALSSKEYERYTKDLVDILGI